MPSIAKTLAAAIVVSTTASAHHGHAEVHNAHKRAAAVKYTTITKETTITTSVAVSYTINTVIESTGVHELISGALTMTFNILPAYFYLETETMTNSVVTSKIISTIPITAVVGTTSTSFKRAASSSSSAVSTSSKASTSAKASTSVKISSTATASSSQTASSAVATQNCGVPSDGPFELGWQTSAGNFPGSSWGDCYWACMTDINYCQSFAYAKNGAMAAGSECIVMKAKTTTAGIWNNIGDPSGNFILYDATCNPPAAAKPVAISSLQCGIPSDNAGGPSLKTLQTSKIGSFGSNTLAECKAKCKFFVGYCASYVYHNFGGTSTLYGNCDIYSVTIEAPGAYEGMNTTSDYTWYSYDSGC